jgi:hypothetical protein
VGGGALREGPAGPPAPGLKQLLNGWYDDAKKKVVAKRHRIAAIKLFFSWLREEAVLTTAEDPTLALKVPPVRPEKAMRDKGYSTTRRTRCCYSTGSFAMAAVSDLASLTRDFAGAGAPFVGPEW